MEFIYYLPLILISIFVLGVFIWAALNLRQTLRHHHRH